MKSVLVTGANRGIGLEFVRQLAAGFKPETTTVIAACRDPDKAQELKTIRDSSNGKVKIIKLDVTSKEDTASLRPTVQQLLGPNTGLNLLINNAGYGSRYTLDELTQDEMNKIYAVNATAPVMVFKELRPLLQLSAEQSSETGMSCSKSAVVNVSSTRGTFALPITKGDISSRLMTYSASKAALNMCMRILAVETLPYEILVILLHPGWVKTDMGTSAAPLSPKQSVADMLKVIASRNDNHHGKLYNKDGNELDW